MSTSHVDDAGRHITEQGAGCAQDDGGGALREGEGAPRPRRCGRDPLLLAIRATTVVLTVGLGLLAAVWSPPPVTAETPLFIPTVTGISALSAASVAFLAFGRYRVLERPSSFWVALGFSAMAILLTFYVLVWPGLGPDGSGYIAADPNTAAWLYNLAGAATIALLLAAALVRWPRPGRGRAHRWVMLTCLAAITLAGAASVRFEGSLPRIVEDGRYPTSSYVMTVVLLLLAGGGALLSTRRYRRTGDTLLGYVALFQISATFSVVVFFFAQQHYDVWWYVSRLLQTGGLAATLFGLLDEYVGLYRRERQRAGALSESERQLRLLNQTLEERVAERTAQLRAMAAELAVAEERERRRLADILHDELQQTLAAAVFHLDLLRERAPTAQYGALLLEPMAMLREAIQTARSLSAELSPNLLRDSGLAAALGVLAHRMEEQHGLRVAVEAVGPKDAPLLPEDVRLLLYRSVRELLFNTVKHAGVREASVRVDRSQPHAARITVSDGGRGFEPDELSGRDPRAGGLGLFSVSERLAHVGGSIHIDSASGRGTRVALVVPLEPSAAAIGTPDEGRATTAPPATPCDDEAVGGRIRILLADDHAIVRQGLRRLLNDQPDLVVVGEAEDGQEAVDLARALHPDVVLMDLAMPQMNGVDATYRIAAELPCTRIIGLSMFDDAEKQDLMRRAGAHAYIPKGGPPADLLAAIRNASET